VLDTVEQDGRRIADGALLTEGQRILNVLSRERSL
jgi:hypothetical protein